MNYQAVLFDLDGTLSDPIEGIAHSTTYALERLNQPPLDLPTMRKWVGPPLRASFATLLGEAYADEAVALYREHYGPIGAYENRLYPGIAELLAELHSSGVGLYVATSKLRSFAISILQHFAVDHYFRYIGGAEIDPRTSSKEWVIGSVLPYLSLEERQHCVMVGDREHDVFGAQAHGLPCIGVTWGYGDAAELHTAGASAVVGSVSELRSFLVTSDE
jgi:phosphoglycolate phosphatase